MRKPGQPAATCRNIPQPVIEHLDRLAVWPVAASILVIAHTLLVLFFWTEPVGWHIFYPSAVLIEAVLFLVSSLLVALVARATHRVQTRVILAEAEVEQSSERILTTSGSPRNRWLRCLPASVPFMTSIAG
jgi:hypothetical protein